MKISKSKQELARIISENGGWRDGEEWAAQDGIGAAPVDFFKSKPSYNKYLKRWLGLCSYSDRIYKSDVKVKNFHQTILSRAEYLHLYPEPDADGWIEWKGGECPVDHGVMIDVRYRDGVVRKCMPALEPVADYHDVMHQYWQNDGVDGDIIAYRLHKPEQSGATDKLSSEAVSAAKIALMSDSIEELVRKPEQSKPEFCESVMRSIPEPDEQVWTNPPTIEQLAADYRNAKDYAELKQQEADDAMDDAGAKLKALEIAGEAIGLIVSPITVKQEPELVITDWRDLLVGDVVECVESNIQREKYNGMVGRLHIIDESDTSTPYLVDFGVEAKIWCNVVKFIRRP